MDLQVFLETLDSKETQDLLEQMVHQAFKVLQVQTGLLEAKGSEDLMDIQVTQACGVFLVIQVQGETRARTGSLDQQGRRGRLS